MTSPSGEKKRRDKGAALVLTHFPDLEANIISIDIMMNLFKSLDPGFLSSKLLTYLKDSSLSNSSCGEFAPYEEVLF